MEMLETDYTKKDQTSVAQTDRVSKWMEHKAAGYEHIADSPSSFKLCCFPVFLTTLTMCLEFLPKVTQRMF